jgi:hypothetical protein
MLNSFFRLLDFIGLKALRRVFEPDCRQISNEALANCREIFTDERLEYLADRYCRQGVRCWTGVPFHKYLLYPHEFDMMVSRISAYDHILAIEAMERGKRLVVSTVN